MTPEGGYRLSPDMAETVPDEGTTLVRENWRRHGNTSHDVDRWWLIVAGTPVAYLHTMTHLNRDEYRFVLCDIEVREGHRGRGHARRIIEAVNAAYGETLHTNGHFTPLGAQALGWVPVLPWEAHTVGVQFADMPFVEDWAALRPIAGF